MAEKITHANFEKYGRVIAYPRQKDKGAGKNIFHIVLREREPSGWRIAYLVVREKKLSRLERHPVSFESLEPVKGRVRLFVARKKDPREIECFDLSVPVVLNKGVWHGVITIGKEAEIKISENAKVSCRYWKLLPPITPQQSPRIP